ncbi:MAG: crossover junction endodeoxyribonuclease RuvC [Candidatus Zipacnadales bacterium]
MQHSGEYIIGIDPGLKITGYGVVRQELGGVTLVEGGLIRTETKALLEQRLQQLHAALSELFSRFHPRIVAVEDLYTKYTHPHTAILMGHARGMAYLAAAEAGAQVVAYPATVVKRALTGSGRAPKEQVGRMVAQFLQLDQPPQPEDVTDALALALCHCVPARERLQRQARRRSRLPAAIVERLEASKCAQETGRSACRLSQRGSPV